MSDMNTGSTVRVNPEVARETQEAVKQAVAMLLDQDYEGSGASAIVKSRHKDAFEENKREFKSALSEVAQRATSLISTMSVETSKATLRAIIEELNSQADAHLFDSVTKEVIEAYDSDPVRFAQASQFHGVVTPSDKHTAACDTSLHIARNMFEPALEAIARVSEPYRELTKRVAADLLVNIEAKLN